MREGDEWEQSTLTRYKNALMQPIVLYANSIETKQSKERELYGSKSVPVYPFPQSCLGSLKSEQGFIRRDSWACFQE